jgi:hypothetical protein
MRDGGDLRSRRKCAGWVEVPGVKAEVPGVKAEVPGVKAEVKARTYG